MTRDSFLLRTGRAVQRRVRGEGSDNDLGIALILVLGVMLALSLVAVAGLAYATNGLKDSRHEQDFDTSQSAVEAASQDFLHHLNLCDDYWAGSTSSCYALANGNVANPAVVAAAPASWTTLPHIPGTNGTSPGQYAYAVIGIPFANGSNTPVVPGTIRLEVWGHSQNVTRTSVVDFKRASLLNYIYYTDIEANDPLTVQSQFAGYSVSSNTTSCSFTKITGTSTSNVNNVYGCSYSGISASSADSVCNAHYYNGPNAQQVAVSGRYYNTATEWQGSVTYYGSLADATLGKNAQTATYEISPGDLRCAINFGGGDSINGPLHTNDAMQLTNGGITFTSAQTETSWGYTASQSSPAAPSSNIWINNCTNSRGQSVACAAPTGNSPVQAGLITLPPDNKALEGQTLNGNAGCEYTGPTQITLNNDGTMSVLSPDTGLTTGSNPSTNKTACYGGTGAMSATTAVKVAIPSDGVVYVQNTPSTSGCKTTSMPYVGSYPNSKDFEANGYNGATSSIPCTQGDVYLSGTLSGQLTIASDSNINITGNVTYKNGTSGNDVLGLIADGFVQIYHPVQCPTSYVPSSAAGTSCTELTGTNSNGIEVDAAILSVQHSFRVENFNRGGNDGTLKVVGVIAQEFRGAVAITGTTGYVKNYVFDSRLQNEPPPSFLNPTSSPWQVYDTSEQQG